VKIPLTNYSQNKFGSIKYIDVYLYSKSNTMKIKSLSIVKEYNRKGEPHRYKNKMYVWIKNETLFDNILNRRSRPYQVYKKEVIPVVMEMIKTKYPDYYEQLKDTKWSWNQKCGCSMCPCSPGFVGDSNGLFNIDVEVTP
jgi:hypothetical protein